MKWSRLERILVSIAAGLFLALGSGTGVALATGQSSGEGGYEPGSMWEALWAGSNLDLTGALEEGSTGDTLPNPDSNIYAALGDSVAAGQGLTTVTSDDPEDKLCGRSSQAYAYTVSQELGWPLLHKACSGATAGDLVTEQHIGDTDIQPQLDAAFAAGTPQLISITAGANDVSWATFIRKCLAGTCGTKSDSAAADLSRAILSAKLSYVLADISYRDAGATPDVVLTGYYDPFSQACANSDPRLTASELTWLKNQAAALNKTLRRTAAGFTHVTFAPVDFTGHDLCSADPWVQGPGDPAPFHPTAQGQQAIAQAVLAAL